MKQVISNCLLLLLLLLSVVLLTSLMVEAQMCDPSGKIRGEKPPGNQCNRDHGSDCCKEGEFYTTYECSPPVSELTIATLTLNGFDKGGDGGDPSACDGKFHKDSTPVVALSTGWFNDYKRCEKFIIIHGNGRSTEAMVVDECDSTMGCDQEHSYQPPCQNDIVDASEAVWQALGVDENDNRYGYMEITWTDA